MRARDRPPRALCVQLKVSTEACGADCQRLRPHRGEVRRRIPMRIMTVALSSACQAMSPAPVFRASGEFASASPPGVRAGVLRLGGRRLAGGVRPSRCRPGRRGRIPGARRPWAKACWSGTAMSVCGDKSVRARSPAGPGLRDGLELLTTPSSNLATAAATGTVTAASPSVASQRPRQQQGRQRHQADDPVGFPHLESTWMKNFSSARQDLRPRNPDKGSAAFVFLTHDSTARDGDPVAGAVPQDPV